MPNQQLIDYIRAQLKLGVTKDDLRRAIADAGWASADTQAAFDVVEGKAPAMPPPVRPPVSMVMSPRRRHRWLPWLSIILVVLVMIAAAIYLSPTLRSVVGWYLEGMPAPATNALVPVGSSTATSTNAEATTTTATSTTSTDSSQSTSTNIIISSSTATTTP